MNYKDRMETIVRYAIENDTFKKARMVENAKNVCVFGLGTFFKEAFESKKVKENYHVNLLSDNDPTKWGQEEQGLPIVSPEKLKDMEDLVVIIMVGNPSPIEKQMNKLGIRWITFVDLTVDDALCGIDVTYIKMDIEGAELNALIGAENTIIKCKPKLAICVYHKTSDFWKIPQYIKSLNSEYKLYLRHHSNKNCWGTVLYAKC